ncbi:MAG TPA: hypothetical protein VFB96_17525 [Pirellulaceae bacterium]|jgi:hypothetical protein|nr:hypothetical protein [Pirellulaceae bacterium]
MTINESTIDIAAGERLQEAAEIERLRKLTDRERGEEILAVCRAAATILEGRRKSGLPPPIRRSWPASTWEFLRKCAANDKRE